jgi:antitoxin VapB
MPLHIRDERAKRLAKQLAKQKGVTLTQAVIFALERVLTCETRPLHKRIDDIAGNAARHPGKRGRTVTKREIDDLWGNK